jgi:hypothetical protein
MIPSSAQIDSLFNRYLIRKMESCISLLKDSNLILVKDSGMTIYLINVIKIEKEIEMTITATHAINMTSENPVKRKIYQLYSHYVRLGGNFVFLRFSNSISTEFKNQFEHLDLENPIEWKNRMYYNSSLVFYIHYLQTNHELKIYKGSFNKILRQHHSKVVWIPFQHTTAF